MLVLQKDITHFLKCLEIFHLEIILKKMPLKLAWDLITKNFSISPEKLIITVFNEDEEAYKIWKKFLLLMTQKF